MDAKLDACLRLTGSTQVQCWAETDQLLMETVVPWVPYLWQYVAHITGPTVAKWGYDQFSGGTAYAHVAVR